MAQRKFKAILIKPSHYDEDGYVIQWWRSPVPSNSLASIYRLNNGVRRGQGARSRRRHRDRSLRRVQHGRRYQGVIRRIKAGGRCWLRRPGRGAIEPFPARVRPCPHVPRCRRSGRDRRLSRLAVALRCCRSCPPTSRRRSASASPCMLERGKGGWRELLRDVDAGQRKPVYNYMNDLPEMAAATLPILPRHLVTRVVGHYSSFDAGRGCPFQCSFCTIINVQGRKSRYRTADDVEGIVRANETQGVTRFFVTDDNFARNRNWEPILDRLIELREQDGLHNPANAPGRYALPPDSRASSRRRPAPAATTVFIGLENINPESRSGTKKRQNKIWEYRDHAAGLEAAARHHLCRLHPRLPDRYAGIDRARHRHHQERAPDRHPGVLLPHAAAGLGRP